MRVVLSTYGSRGDVEPVAGLAMELKALGADVRVSAPPDDELAALLTRAGVELVPAFSQVREWVTKVLTNRASVNLPQLASEVMAGQLEAIDRAAEGCDAMVACGLFSSACAARCVADQRRIPYVYAAYCPYFVPSTHHRPHEYPGWPRPPGVTDNRALWAHDVQRMNALFGVAMNHHRATLGLEAVDNVRDHVFTDHTWLAADPMLSPWAPTDLVAVVQTGAWILPDERPLSRELLAFLAAGAAPVYVGFGSMPMQATRDAARLAIEASRARGRRVIVSRGWAELAPQDDAADCFVVGDVNQQALFPRVAAVVHHGGAGTTTAAARSGTPQVVVPQMADQPYWAGRVDELGIGAAHAGPLESLAAALGTALHTDTRTRAAVVAAMIRSDGARVAAQRVLDVLCRERA